MPAVCPAVGGALLGEPRPQATAWPKRALGGPPSRPPNGPPQTPTKKGNRPESAPRQPAANQTTTKRLFSKTAGPPHPTQTAPPRRPPPAWKIPRAAGPAPGRFPPAGTPTALAVLVARPPRSPGVPPPASGPSSGGPRMEETGVPDPPTKARSPPPGPCVPPNPNKRISLPAGVKPFPLPGPDPAPVVPGNRSVLQSRRPLLPLTIAE